MKTETHLCFSESVVCLFSDLVKSYELISLNNFPQMDILHELFSTDGQLGECSGCHRGGRSEGRGDF